MAGNRVDARTRKWLLNGRNGEINPELDPIRSATFGYASLTSTSQAAVLSTPTGKLLFLDTLIVNNDSAVPGTIILYDSTSTTTPVAKIQVMPATSAPCLIATGLKGLKFSTGIYAAQGSSFAQQITVGAHVCDADAS
jgi:hypothetical protein